MKIQSILLVSLVALLTSCAGIINGTSQSITVTSTPEGAEVFIDGNNMGETPLTVKLKKNKYDNIMVKKSGYKTVTRPISKVYDNTALLNIFWDLSTTDMITGAAYEYEPSNYNFTLSKVETEKK